MGKCLRLGGKVKVETGRGASQGKLHKWHPKINLYSKFHKNWTIEKYLNPKGRMRGGGEFKGIFF